MFLGKKDWNTKQKRERKYIFEDYNFFCYIGYTISVFQNYSNDALKMLQYVNSTENFHTCFI